LIYFARYGEINVTRKFGYNLLTYLYFPTLDRGVAKMVLQKSACKTITKIIRNHKKDCTSDKVRAIATFLNSNVLAKFPNAPENATFFPYLTEEFGFVLLENWELFLLWIKKIRYGLIITVTKNANFNGWNSSTNRQKFKRLNVSYSYNNKEFGLNTIIFNNGLLIDENGLHYHSQGMAKIILTPKLWKEMKNNNNVQSFNSYLHNEKIFCYLSLEPNSTKILSYAFGQFANLIFNYQHYIDDAFVKFPQGIVLEFETIKHEQFNLKQISQMPIINFANLTKDMS